MDRKAFLKLSCMGCIGSALGLSVLESCSSQNMVTGTLTDKGLSVPTSIFIKGKDTFKNYVVVSHPKLKNPISVFRVSDHEYSAVLMKCTHQGAELQVFGDRLQCPAHGSEFNQFGTVMNGPAKKTLRKFPVDISGDTINITLI